MRYMILALLTVTHLGAIEGDIRTQPRNAKQEEVNDNVRLVNEVISRIKGRFNHYNVNVYAEDGIVTLRGTVGSSDDKRSIENEVQHIGGVTKVKNELQVKK